MSIAGKIAYKPVGLLAAAGASIVAGYAFRRIWNAVAGEEFAPAAMDEERGWTEILAAAALQGAIFAIVRAVVDRGSATGVRRLTGRWPG